MLTSIFFTSIVGFVSLTGIVFVHDLYVHMRNVFAESERLEQEEAVRIAEKEARKAEDAQKLEEMRQKDEEFNRRFEENLRLNEEALERKRLGKELEIVPDIQPDEEIRIVAKTQKTFWEAKEDSKEVQPRDFKKMTVKELKAAAREQGITPKDVRDIAGASNLKKHWVEALEAMLIG